MKYNNGFTKNFFFHFKNKRNKSYNMNNVKQFCSVLSLVQVYDLNIKTFKRNPDKRD